ncbi:two-component regulator propeller domain-containing protein [Sphingobacterium sp. LRF_L2]|uniref:hybrid sensor histidine kinase/response regulator n=1 Tax=Sphingobacterium sp. LRF_L2 TaxID=3369421 RepID=UPI003F648C1D
MKLYVKVFIYILFLLSQVHAQNTVEYLGIEQGLSNDYITDIYQDNDGFMWFGTANGLNRYDGYEFKIFKNVPHDIHSLPDNRVTDIIEDKKGILYISTKVGAAVLHPAHSGFTRLKLQTKKNKLDSIDFSIHQFEMDKKGNIFAGSGKAGLLAIRHQENEVIAESIPLLLPHQKPTTTYNVSGTCQTPDGKLWIVIHHVGLCYYDSESHTVRLQMAGNFNASSMTASKDGDIWFSTNWGISRYNTTKSSFQYYTSTNGLCQERIVHLYFGKDQKIWACSDGGGIQKINIQTGQIAHLPLFSGTQLTSNSVFAVYEDRQDRQWIGTLRGGVNLIDPNKGKFQLVKNNSENQKISSRDFVLSIEESENDNLWVGTDGAGLLKWNMPHQRFINYPLSNSNLLKQAFVTGLIEDKNNFLWIATYDRGILKLNTKTGDIKSYDCFYPQTSYSNKAVWRLYEDSEERLWASTLNGGHVYQLDKKTDQFIPLDIPIYDILSFMEGEQNTLWMGSWAELVYYDISTKKHKIFPIGTPVRFIQHAEDKKLWIGTEGGGLLLFDTLTGKIIRYTEKEGLPSNTLLNALRDKRGNLWISTYNGLSKFNTDDRSFQNFYKSDGLQSNQFNYNAALTLKNGEMAFGGIRGFNIFNPEDMHLRSQFPSLVLTQFQIDNKPYTSYNDYVDYPLSAIDALEIPYDNAILSFSFAALEYSFPDKIRYSYFLEGWDKDWNYVDKQRSAHYSHLKEGTYTLRIRSTDANGKWNSVERLIKIRVLPPWWRSLWAYLFYGVALATALYLYIRYVKHRTELLYRLKTSEFERSKEHELNEKKITFFTHIAHEFRTPLTLIVNPLKEILYQSEPPEHQTEIQHVYSNARRLLSLVDKLLLFRKADSDFDELRIVKLDFSVLAREVFYCFQQLAHSRHINYTFSNTEEDYSLYGDREKLEICLFNLFHNAIKYTANQGKVDIVLRLHYGNIILEINDSGNGTHQALDENIFKPFQRDYSSNSQAKEGFGIGLFLVKKFAQAHQGNITFQQNSMGGTTFSLAIPRSSSIIKDNLIFEDVPEHSIFIKELMDEDTPSDIQKVASEYEHQEVITTPLTTSRDIMLVVDDNDDIRNYISKLFLSNFDVVQAESGEKALELLRTLEPSIVISDVVMHQVSGIDLCEKIKKNNKLSHIPVILLTASFSPDVKLKGIEGGADDYITKPFDKEILTARVNNLIQNRHRLHQYFHSAITLQVNDHKIPVEYKDFLEQAIAVVEANLQDVDFSVKTLAEQLGMSHSNLYRRIKSISGKSANEFIRYIRLRKVARLLIDTNANINEAAYAAGFSDIKHFRQQFTKLFGDTPSAYRKKYAHLKNKYHVHIK